MSLCNCGSARGDMDVEQVKSHPDEIAQKREYSFTKNIKNYILEFCKEGSLHGFKYLGENRTWIEKLWWLLSLIGSLYLCVSLILISYDKYENSPVIVSFATKETATWEVPFPTVTICPEIKSLPKVFNYSKYLQMKREGIPLTDDEERKFGYLSLVCGRRSDINYTDGVNEFGGDEIYEFLNTVQPQFFKTISDCKYMGLDEKCENLFLPIITDEGICYTFNIVDRTQIFTDIVKHFGNFHKVPVLANWTVENGYPLSDRTHTYPRRALFAGATFALEAKLTVYDDQMEYSCSSGIQGFKMQISHPARMPRVRQQFFRLPLDTISIAAVEPDITTTSQKVKNYHAAKRNCYFPSERQLLYFEHYTQQNCQIECKTNSTINKCGCVNFYMPRDNKTNICSGGKLNCIYSDEQELLTDSIDKKLELRRQGKPLESDKCDCKPICTSMYYDTEYSQSPWDWKKIYRNEEEGKHMAMFQVFFKRNQFTTLERNELYGANDFLANFGGLMGLCVGFSLLSLIEILYYLTLRIICNIKLFGCKNWSGKTN